MRMRSIALAAAAVSVVCGATTAGAFGAEVGQCVKAAKVEKRFHGAYLDGKCMQPASEAQVAEGKHNKFDWVVRTAATNTHSIKSLQLNTRSAGGTELNCPRVDVDYGPFWENAIEGSITLHMLCQLGFNVGENVGQHRLNWEEYSPLRSTLEGPAGHAWERFEPPVPGAPIIEGEYETGELVRLVGTFDAVLQTPDKPARSFTVKAGEGGCALHCEAGESPQSLTLELSHDGGLTWESEPTALTWEYKFATAFGEKVEVRN